MKDSLDIYEAADPAGSEIERDNEGGLTIFLVHGRDVAAREEVRRLLERVCTARVVVLADQPFRGLTIIEKLESHVPGAAYVVAVLTGDDVGRLQTDSELSPRARQNVIFELGYAIGLLGRRNVAVLYEEQVELPGDYAGVGYVEFDKSGGWKLNLVAELKAAAIDADANCALG